MKSNNLQLVSNVCDRIRLLSLIDWVAYVDETPLHKDNIIHRYDMFEYNEQCN
ncbi:MAG: hypothetical protein ACXAAH_09550 [Promethearchaeota archaeon]|jgi:hypothetical protein